MDRIGTRCLERLDNRGSSRSEPSPPTEGFLKAKGKSANVLKCEDAAKQALLLIQGVEDDWDDPTNQVHTLSSCTE